MNLAGEAPLWTLISGSEQSSKCYTLVSGEVGFQALPVPCQDQSQQWNHPLLVHDHTSAVCWRRAEPAAMHPLRCKQEGFEFSSPGLC